jgi:nucleotide-binding universal stress UspA family protein
MSAPSHASASPDQPATESPLGDAAPDALAPLGSRLRSSPLVVAVSDGPEGAGPVRVAAALEARYGTSISAIQVLDTASVPAPLTQAFALAREMIGDVPYAADVIARRQQFGEWLGATVAWPVYVGVGTPASEVLKYAEGQGAALIVLGLRRHGIVDRVLRDETTLTVARRARAAVLGVVPTLRGLPRQAVVGVDFGPASARAARAALDILGPGGADEPAVLRLVYVDRNADTREETAGQGVIARLGIGAAFEQLVRALAAPPDVRVEWIIRRGAPAEELLAYADEVDADLIAVGSLRHERFDRWLLGSVTTDVVRDGRCSVLVIPPPA